MLHVVRREKKYVFPKRNYLYTRIDGLVFQKTLNLISTYFDCMRLFVNTKHKHLTANLLRRFTPWCISIDMRCRYVRAGGDKERLVETLEKGVKLTETYVAFPCLITTPRHFRLPTAFWTVSTHTHAREHARTLISPSGFTLSTKKIPRKLVQP